MNVCILGGTGNISTHVTERLVADGHEVTLLNRGSSPAPAGARQVTADRNDESSLSAAVADLRPDAAIDFIGFRREQCEMAHRVFRSHTGQFVFISSTTVYEKPHRRLPLVEDGPLGNKHSPYARRKIECEEYLRGAHGDDFPVTIVRPSHTFGRSWIPSPLNGGDYTVAARIEAGKPIVVHDDGQSLWTLTAASDFAVGLAGLLGNPAALGQTVHITHDQVLTWNAIYDEIGRALGREPEVVHIPSKTLVRLHPQAEQKLFGDKAEHGVFDNRKIKRLVPGFECVKSFRTALGESLDWLNADPARKRINATQDALIDEWVASCEL